MLNAKHGNNGIMYYGRKDDFLCAEGGIDVVSNGEIATGDVYPQTDNVSVLFDAYIINLKKV